MLKYIFGSEYEKAGILKDKAGVFKTTKDIVGYKMIRCQSRLEPSISENVIAKVTVPKGATVVRANEYHCPDKYDRSFDTASPKQNLRTNEYNVDSLYIDRKEFDGYDEKNKPKYTHHIEEKKMEEYRRCHSVCFPNYQYCMGKHTSKLDESLDDQYYVKCLPFFTVVKLSEYNKGLHFFETYEKAKSYFD